MSLPRLLAGAHRDRPLSLAEHLETHGPPGSRVGPELIEAVRLAGLRGRGGAAFPCAVKLDSVARQRGPRSVLVNGAEGEPMSAKDRVLCELAPHLVLDGVLSATAAVGARDVVVALPRNATGALGSLRNALQERSTRARVTIRPVPVSYLAGEESALISHLNGGALKPYVVPPRPFERGLGRRPTLVQNPETLAQLALIDRHGPAWFRELGDQLHPGSALVTVAGAVAQPGVQEIAYGAPLSSVLASAGQATEQLRAVLVGGYHGSWISGHSLESITLDDDGLRPHGASLAAGVIVALGASACPLRELAQTMAWLASQSAGQCGPCANGLPAIAALLSDVVDGRAGADSGRRLAGWGADVSGRGACHLPDGAARFLASGLRVFADEFAEHVEQGPCPACRRPTTLLVGPPLLRREAA